MAQIIQYTTNIRRPDQTTTRIFDGVSRPPLVWVRDYALAAAVRIFRLVGFAKYADETTIPNAAIVDNENTLLLWGGTRFWRRGIENLEFGGNTYPINYVTIRF